MIPFISRNVGRQSCLTAVDDVGKTREINGVVTGMLIGNKANANQAVRASTFGLSRAKFPVGHSPRLVTSICLVSCAGLLAIIVLSLVPAEWRPSTGLSKELDHGIAYCIVAALLAIAGLVRWPGILGVIPLAAVLEVGQRFVPGRDAALVDFFMGAAGGLLGSALCCFVTGLLVSKSAWPMFERAAGFAGPVRESTMVVIAAAGLLAAWSSMAAVHGTAGWLGAGLALAVLAIAVVDGQRFLIPDSLNAAALVLGLACSVILGQGEPGAALTGAMLRAAFLASTFLGVRLIFVRLRGRHGLGLGDVKLAAVAGVWLDWPLMLVAVEIAAISALAVYLLRRYVLRHPLKASSRLPFGLYFAPAIWIAWLLQATVMRGW